jgi:hypothetical protein
MRKQLFTGSLGILAAIALPLSAQTVQRRASMAGGGSPDRGKCTVEIVVDGAAEVEIRGDTAFLRNLKGQLPQWRRFECTGVMPPNPGDFRFAGVDGRGEQRLVRDPRNGGTAVVQIQDPGNGTEGYTFDIFWGNRIESRGPDYREPGFRDGGGPRRFTQDDAIRSCQEIVRQEAANRFNARNATFRRFDANDNPGGRDSVRGWFDARRGNGRDEAFRYSCSVNFDSGQVWNAQVEPAGDRGGYGDGNESGRAISSCQRAVEDRIARDGFGNARIDSIRVDDRPGRQDWVVGNARAEGRNGRRELTFSCSVNLRNGDVNSVDVQRR